MRNKSVLEILGGVAAGAAVTIGVDDGRLVDLPLARTFELQEYVLFIPFSS